ncbi:MULTISPECIES: TetR/AcrR family transcriptional regulator [Actinokineospora]|uniref:TetR family transcriptional regulator n=1 Tax=Actinokineospora fastidiosa TaxID=1816 RepID=A0A918GHW6_9PSEU|nr:MULTISPECIES: TetR/AcrR family transcriptional regulator [Actinokineospora]UVS81069.1 Tetracycline repressor protein class H [Actinokineospora sp. UTMC 2448]GGS39277.1 TetR family transcriptional regulator [Actinokineospora fastidiosa]
MGRRAKFSRAEIEDAAIAVVDEHGLGGLTMRAVATRVGTGPMTLYNYVDDRTGLDALVVDGVLRDITIPPATDDWRADLRAIATEVWQAVRRHPNAIPLVLARRSHSPVFLDVAEALVAALARSGRTGASLLAAFRAVTTLATAFAQTELGADRDSTIGRFRALPADRYPRLLDLAGAAQASTPEAEFDAAVTALLDGLGQL